MSITSISILLPSAAYTMLPTVAISGTVVGNNITRIELLNPATGQGLVTVTPSYNESTSLWEWITTTNIALISGSNTITATAFNDLDESLSTDITITHKTVSLSIITPDPLVLQTTTTNVNFSGEVTGDIVAGDITTIVVTNNKPTETNWTATFSFDSNKVIWSRLISLANTDLNTLTVKVTNSVGETISNSINVQVWAATITVTNLVSGTPKFTSLAQVPIAGTISGTVNVIASLQITNIESTHSLPATVSHDGSKHIWSVADLALSHGNNTINIIATNTAGGILSTQVTLISDSIKPQATFHLVNNATNVSTTEKIKVLFDKDMNPTTVITALTIAPALGTWQAGTTNKEFILNYNAPCKANTTYLISLAATAKDYLSLTPANQQYIDINNFANTASFTFTTGAYRGALSESEVLTTAQSFRYIPQIIANTFRYKQYKGSLYVTNDTMEMTPSSEFEYIPIKLVNTFRYKEFKGTLYNSLIDKYRIDKVAINNLKLNRLHLFDSPNDTYQIRTISPEIRWATPHTTMARLHYQILLSTKPDFIQNLAFDTRQTPEVFEFSENGTDFFPMTQYGTIPSGFARFKCPIKLTEGIWFLKLFAINRREDL